MILFLTVYLGLISGRQPFELRADPSVTSVELRLDGAKVAALSQQPWTAVVDLGPAIAPHEVVAIGFDAKGNEIGRASQIINLPRPVAELEISIERDAEGRPKAATLRGHHVSYAEMRRATLTLDSLPLLLDRNLHASLRKIDMKRPHVLAAEMRFKDGTVARREIVFGGEFAESIPTQLTAAAVSQTSTSSAPPEDCFMSNGTALRVSSVDKPGAVVMIVRDPSPAGVNGPLMYSAVFDGQLDTSALRQSAMFDKDTTMELLSPAADRFTVPDQPVAIMFPAYENKNTKEGLFWFITTTKIIGPTDETPRQWADAAAVAAVHAVSDGRRRAVIVILGSAPDKSLNTPQTVRKYLDSVGVPLFVWSVLGPRSDLGDAWGPIVDVSTKEKVEQATEEVKRALDVQRIAWIYADPLTALHAQVKQGCGYALLARP